MTKGKLPAFTILEMTITMLLAAIVIGITYSVYAIIFKTYTVFHARNEDLGVIIQVDRLLKRDIAKGKVILKSAHGFTIPNSTQTISYDFEPEYVVRKAGIIDTFKVKTVDLITSFENQPVNEVSEATEQNRLDEISFTLTYKETQIPYHYYKSYSAVNLMQRNSHALH